MIYKNPVIESSYGVNDIGKTLYDLVLEKKPKKIVEFGCLFGYSTVAMAMALDEIGQGTIVVYDLWEKYPHKHSTREQTLKNIELYGLLKYVELKNGDYYEWIKNPEQFDILHVDISNTGEVIELLYSGTKDQIGAGSIVIFEGGTVERDNVEWMKKYKRKNIIGCGAPFEVIRPEFPGLSKILYN